MTAKSGFIGAVLLLIVQVVVVASIMWKKLTMALNANNRVECATAGAKRSPSTRFEQTTFVLLTRVPQNPKG